MNIKSPAMLGFSAFKGRLSIVIKCTPQLSVSKLWTETNMTKLEDILPDIEMK